MERVLFVVCFLAVTYAVASLIHDTLFKQSSFINSINQDIGAGNLMDKENFPLYPRITLCRKPFYKTDFNHSYLDLVGYIMLSIGISFDTFNSQELGMAVRLVENQLNIQEDLREEELQFKQRLQLLEERYQDRKKSGGFDLEKFVRDHVVDCREIFSQCIIFMTIYDCCELFEPVYTTDGLCFMVTDVSPIVEKVYDAVVTDTVILDLNTPEMPDRDTEYGFRIYFTDSRLDYPIFLNTMPGENIVPNVVTTIKAQLIKTDRIALHTPWHGMYPDCPRLTVNSTFSTDRYSEDMCQHRFLGEMMRNACQCKPFFRLHEDTAHLKTCEPLDMYDCFLKAMFGFRESGLSLPCKKPCVFYSYKTESSYIGLGADNDSISRIEILFDSKQYLYKEYRKTTLSSLFSQIGGSLGLYLGASIITLFELVTFIITWLWYRLAPAKVAIPSSKTRRR